MKGNMSQSRKVEELKHFVQNSRKVNGQTLDNDVQIDNVESADKLKTARTIGLSGAVLSTPTTFDGSENVDIPITAIKEAYLDWGGKSRYNWLSPVDNALLPELGTNRLAFFPDSAVKFERSEDAGVTWNDVSEQFDGTALCTTSVWFGNGNTELNQSVSRQHRITLDCTNGGLFCYLAKIMIRVSTDGATGCMCKIEFGDGSENTVWTVAETTLIYGWSGWNTINVNHVPLGGAKSDIFRYIRFTFSISDVNSQYTSDFAIMSIRFVSSAFFGNASNTMALTGHIYTFDSLQNVEFPKNLTIKGNTLKIGSTTITETQLKALLNLLTT